MQGHTEGRPRVARRCCRQAEQRRWRACPPPPGPPMSSLRVCGACHRSSLGNTASEATGLCGPARRSPGTGSKVHEAFTPWWRLTLKYKLSPDIEDSPGVASGGTYHATSVTVYTCGTRVLRGSGYTEPPRRGLPISRAGAHRPGPASSRV